MHFRKGPQEKFMEVIKTTPGHFTDFKHAIFVEFNMVSLPLFVAISQAKAVGALTAVPTYLSSYFYEGKMVKLFHM